MSRHHILPPIIYSPPPKPKKIENRRTKGVQKRDAASATGVSASEETDETAESAPPSGVIPRAAANPYAPIEGLESRTQQAPGKLSADTLKTMLVVQELENQPRTADGVPATKR
jgi:hypothetical protein